MRTTGSQFHSRAVDVLNAAVYTVGHLTVACTGRLRNDPAVSIAELPKAGVTMSALLKPKITPHDYLESERASKTKHEYYAGQVYEMACAGERHNLVAGNVSASLHSQLRRRPCTVYPSDMRVKIAAMELYTYPDISALCGVAQFEDEQRDILLNPTVIVEVLSPSTENYDRGKKFQFYRTLQSLVEYLLVAQDTMHVEHYTRQPDGHWLLAEFDQPTDVLHLASIGCDLALADVYEKVLFDQVSSQE